MVVYRAFLGQHGLLMLASGGNNMHYDTAKIGEVSRIVCRYPVENLQVEGVSSFQHALVF